MNIRWLEINLGSLSLNSTTLFFSILFFLISISILIYEKLIHKYNRKWIYIVIISFIAIPASAYIFKLIQNHKPEINSENDFLADLKKNLACQDRLSKLSDDDIKDEILNVIAYSGQWEQYLGIFLKMAYSNEIYCSKILSHGFLNSHFFKKDNPFSKHTDDLKENIKKDLKKSCTNNKSHLTKKDKRILNNFFFEETYLNIMLANLKDLQKKRIVAELTKGKITIEFECEITREILTSIAEQSDVNHISSKEYFKDFILQKKFIIE